MFKMYLESSEQIRIFTATVKGGAAFSQHFLYIYNSIPQIYTDRQIWDIENKITIPTSITQIIAIYMSYRYCNKL